MEEMRVLINVLRQELTEKNTKSRTLKRSLALTLTPPPPGSTVQVKGRRPLIVENSTSPYP